jgi:hypothetical protein
VSQVARNFCAELEDAGRRVRFLIHDRDTELTTSFEHIFSSIGVETILTPVRALNANAFAERWVRTVRADCLDHLLVVSGATSKESLPSMSSTTTGDDRIAASTSRRRNKARPLTKRAASAAVTSSAGSSTSTSSSPDRYRWGRRTGSTGHRTGARHC